MKDLKHFKILLEEDKTLEDSGIDKEDKKHIDSEIEEKKKNQERDEKFKKENEERDLT